MTEDLKSQEEQEIRAQAGQVRERLEGLTADLRIVDEEVERLAPERTHHELLDQACGALEKLGELGAASLFWGEQIEPGRVADRLTDVRSRVGAFQAQLGKLDERRQAILGGMGREEENLEILGEDLYQIREAEERRKLEWIVERDISAVPPHVQLMAWARGGEDDRRFRRSLAASLLASLLFALLFPMINLPESRRFEPDAVPRRLAQFIREAQPKPAPPSPVVAGDAGDQQPEEPESLEVLDPPDEAPPPPQVQDVAAAQPVPAGLPGPLGPPPGPIGPEPAVVAPPGPPELDVASAGILAFTDQIASLAQDRVAPRLGADARLGDADDVSRASAASRSLLTSNAPGSSGGIDVDSLNRSVRGGGGGGGGGSGLGGGGGGGGGGGLPGVEIGRATSSIASIAGDDRPTASGGPGASRTDEEIQIVFDRHKAEFYRFYNRELRNDPALQGQMILRLTIEPDGSVSMCVLQSTDMDAPDLATQVVNRVLTIDFGAKQDVGSLTIVYPIDFLPASQ